MVSRDLQQVRLQQPIYLLIELFVRLFTLGIFSNQGGAKAWFELILVTAALCASGYIVWWQVPLLIIAIILATLAAGMFSILAPQYLEVGILQPNQQISAALQIISKYNLSEISTLSDNRLEQRLVQLHQAQKIFESNPNLLEQISELQLVLKNINHACDVATDKVELQRKAYEDLQKKIWEQEQQRREAEEKRKQEEAARKAQHEQWLNEQRRREKFTGGCPPDDRYNPPKCRVGYPIKVTLNKKEDGFDGIIWKPSDTEYDAVTPRWCYQSVDEAKNERGQYRFRRPKNSQGRSRP